MKITLNANTQIDAKNFENFTGIDISNGAISNISAHRRLAKNPIDKHFESVIQSSFGWKLLKKIDSIANILSPINQLDTSIAKHVDEALTYLNSQTNFSFDKTEVHLKIDSKGYQTNLYLLKNFLPDKPHLFPISSPNDMYAAGDAYSSEITFGTNIFKNKEEFITLKEKYGISKVVEYVLFHELGHSLEYSNKSYYPKPPSNNPELQNTLSKIERFISSKVLSEVVSDIKENFPEITTLRNSDGHLLYMPPDVSLMQELHVLRSEIYADSMSLLISRNKEIEKCAYVPEKFHEYMRDVSKMRESEHINIVKKSVGTSELYLMDHLTSPGVNHLAESIVDLDSHSTKALSSQQMNELCLKSAYVGISRTILTVMKYNPDIAAQFNTLFNTSFNDETGAAVFNNTNNTPRNISGLKADAGSEYVLNLEKNYHKILEDLNISLKDESIVDKNSLRKNSQSAIFMEGMMPYHAITSLNAEDKLINSDTSTSVNQFIAEKTIESMPESSAQSLLVSKHGLNSRIFGSRDKYKTENNDAVKNNKYKI